MITINTVTIYVILVVPIAISAINSNSTEIVCSFNF